MKIGIFKISTSCELTIIKTVDTATKASICVSYTLNPRIPLTDCQSRIKNLDLDELWVTIQGQVVLGHDSDHIITTRLSKIVSGEKMSIIHREDLDKIKYMAEQLNIPVLKLYDMYDIYAKMGEQKPVILCGDYYGDQYAYMYIKDGEIKEHRIWRNVDNKVLMNMMSEFDVNLVLPIYNNLLSEPIQKKVSNWDYVSSQEKTLLALSLGSILIKPVREFNLKQGILVEKTIPVVQDTPLIKRDIKSFINNPTVSRETAITENALKTPFHKKIFTLGKVLTASGFIVATLLSASIAINKQLPQNIEYLQGKQEELAELLNPKQSTVDYYTDFLESSKAGNGNLDANYIAQISGVSVDGIIAEIRLEKDNVGIVVFLKDPNTLEQLTADLNGIFEVTQVADKGSVSLDNTSLTKYIINGIR